MIEEVLGFSWKAANIHWYQKDQIALRAVPLEVEAGEGSLPVSYYNTWVCGTFFSFLLPVESRSRD